METSSASSFQKRRESNTLRKGSLYENRLNLNLPQSRPSIILTTDHGAIGGNNTANRTGIFARKDSILEKHRPNPDLLDDI
jgi:hypothetical protein